MESQQQIAAAELLFNLWVRGLNTHCFCFGSFVLLPEDAPHDVPIFGDALPGAFRVSPAAPAEHKPHDCANGGWRVCPDPPPF